MRWTRRAKLKTIAICLGAIVTVKVAPMTVLATVAAMSQFSRGPAFALWPALGMVGLVGFWVWAFSRRALYGARRVAISALIVLGIVMVSPFIFLGGILLALAALGMTAGVFALAEMWLPDSVFERTGARIDSP